MTLTNTLTTPKYTEIVHEDEYKFNAPHHFRINNAETGEILVQIDMQEGAIKECGINGCTNEDLITIVLTRLNSFQNSKFKCRENACAIDKLEEALMWLKKRTCEREIRNVEGTSKI